MKPDDSSVSPEEYLQIRRDALKVLQEAGACGRLPTPVNEVMQGARIIVAPENVLTESFLRKIRSKALKVGRVLKSAISKVLGIFDTAARIVYIDRAVLEVKQAFLKLHETAHGVLSWQKDIYAAIEDCEKTLSPEVSDTFDREANVFASEVLFQLDTFRNQAADYQFGLAVPLRLSKQYGASVYSTIRRYVSTHRRNCAVLILNPPVLGDGHGFVCSLRRVVWSESFEAVFGRFSWPEQYTPDDEIGSMVPLGDRKMSRPTPLFLKDQNGTEHECIAEAFRHKYQVFILIHEIKALTGTTVGVPHQ